MGGTVGRLSSAVGVVCALLGILIYDGISIEVPGIILGIIGYVLGLQKGDRTAQVLGIVAVVLNGASIFASAMLSGPQ